MYDLCAYFTNDGTIGLYSKDDNDVYHSTFGAITEAWEKFILPAKLENFLQINSSVKILDICYGIGYNSKAALQYFLNLQSKKKFLKKNNKNNLIFQKYSSHLPPDIDAIDTDNTFVGATSEKEELKEAPEEETERDLLQKNEKIEKICSDSHINYSAIDTDNITGGSEKIFACNNSFQSNGLQNKNVIAKHLSSGSKLLIDAVDLDDTLIKLSPFIKSNSFPFGFPRRFTPLDDANGKLLATVKDVCKTTEATIQKCLSKKKIALKKEYLLSKEMNMILIIELLKSNPKLLDDNNLQSILNDKKYAPFLDKNMINFARFYQNRGYNHKQTCNKTAFLHNIYYRYLSKSYKLAQKSTKNNSISLNFHSDDARKFVLTSKEKYDLIFLDAFTPAKCPALWTIEFFKQLFDRLDENGMIITYSNAVLVRNAFLRAGFSVGKILDANVNKFAGTIATKNPKLIDIPLDEKDLALINSKAGIPYRDEQLNLPNNEIIKNRESDVQNSNLLQSSKALKGLKHAKL